MPRLCEGNSNEDHKGWWMESCSNFIRPIMNHCNTFNWREDIPKGPSPKAARGGIPCPGVLCRDLSKPHGINRDCYYSLCKNCCFHAHIPLPSLRSCKVAAHRPSPAQRANLAAAGTVPADPNGVPSGPIPARSSLPALSATTLVAPAATQPHQPPGAAPASFVVPSTAAATAPPSATLRLLEIQQLQHAADSAIQQSDAADADKTIFVHWWSKNDEPSKLYEIVAPYFPKWHPKDSVVLVQLYHVDTEMFEWWDGSRWNWITASPTTARRDISYSRKIGPALATELHYRTLGVVRAEGMPTRTVRRRSDSSPEPVRSEHGGSPTKRLRHSSVPGTPLSRPLTPSDLEAVSDGGSEYGGSEVDYPPSSDGGSSRYASRAPSVAPPTAASNPFWLSPSKDYAYGPSTPSSRRVSPSTGPFSLPGPSQAGSVSELLSTLDTILPTAPAALILDDHTELDPHAPRASSKSAWPLKYVIDMAIGFHVLRRRVDAGMSRPMAFEDVFGCKYSSSTWSDNFRAFEAASAVPGEVNMWADYGREGAMLLAIPYSWLRAPTLQGNLITTRSRQQVSLSQLPQQMSSSSPISVRTPLLEKDIEHLALPELVAILRSWAAGNSQKSRSVNLIKDIDRARTAVVRDRVSVCWKDVEELLELSELPSQAPPKSSKRNWAVDTYMVQLVRHGRMPLPRNSVGYDPTLSKLACHSSLVHQIAGHWEVILWRPYLPEEPAANSSEHPAPPGQDVHSPGSRPRPPIAGRSIPGVNVGEGLHPSLELPANEFAAAECAPQRALAGSAMDYLAEARGAHMAAQGIPTVQRAHVAAIGFDRRMCSPNQPSGQPVLSILSLVPLSYNVRDNTVTAPVEKLVDALVQNAFSLERNIYISVTEHVSGQEFLTRVAMVNENGDTHILVSFPHLYLVTFNDQDKPPQYQAVLWKWPFVVEQGGSVTAGRVKHPRTEEEDVCPRGTPEAPSEPIKYTITEQELAVVDWLSAQFGSDIAVLQMQSATANVGQHILHLLRWAKVVDRIRSNARAGPSAPPAGRGVRITQKHIGTFVRRTEQWVRDALACRTLAHTNRQNDAVRKTLQALHKNRTILGMKKLRAYLKDAVQRDAPAVHEEFEVEFAYELSSDDDDDEEDIPDDDDARDLLGLPELRRRARVPQARRGVSEPHGTASPASGDSDRDAEGEEDAEDNRERDEDDQDEDDSAWEPQCEDEEEEEEASDVDVDDAGSWHGIGSEE
ncbi:hypothetical protein L227DRAFT_564153 [Lentinus tigrinus ALCF2SS1-6]|uniref:Uncharacterized protein n=1 Tax=Lentinus tigrinus ALCF2SS1-6 TaxID=1328759 RepID=A0A5C2SDK2_9APHY|nr:hypothetical protein L227DRAFT_564153 [Lentinus tigrinus ALCF2SS1-6]